MATQDPVQIQKAETKTQETQKAENETQGQKGKPDLTVGDVKYLLALSLVKNDIKDDNKIPFDNAKAIIELLIHVGQETTPDPPPKPPTTTPPDGVIGKNDHRRLEDLGLGRGVDVTKPYPWQSKSSFQVRKVKCENIIGTEESRQREFYEEEVNSVLTQQFNTNLTIEEPSNSLAIGIGAEHSRSFAETRKMVGHKIMTRTASFRTDCIEDDLVEDDLVEDDFEEKLSKWIVERMETRRKWSLERDRDDQTLIKIPTEDNKSYKERLEKYIKGVADKVHEFLPPEKRPVDEATEKKAYRESWALLQDCYDYVEHVGVTHYVHTIKLGAAEYEVLTQETYDSKLTATPSFEVYKVAKAEVSANAGYSKHRMRKRQTMNSIGRISKPKPNDPTTFTVKREAPDEAVLEIELKSLHSLVQMRALHLALQWALKRYIRLRKPKKEGPYLIACGPDTDGHTVYWQVTTNGQNMQVQGTQDKKQASLFYIIKTESSMFSHEFYIGYVGNDMAALECPRGPADPLSKSKPIAPIPYYVTADLGPTGSSSRPLGVTAGTHKNHARFSLHSSALRKFAFTRSKVDVDKWTEGGGYFINCARRMFKFDGYVAMDKQDGRGGRNATRRTAGGQEQILLEEIKDKSKGIYTTCCKTSVTNHGNGWPWMVFHLLPGEHKDLTEQEEIEPGDLSEPLIDWSEHPVVHKSDARDFEYLFGKPTKEHEPAT